MSVEPRSPNWSTTTKVFVAAVMFVLFGLAVYLFQSVIGLLVIAGIIAYLLNPIIVMLDEHTPLSRGLAIALVYCIFAAVVIGLLIAAGVTLYSQTQGLVQAVQEIILAGPENFNQLISQPIQLGAWSFDPRQMNIELNQVVQELFSAMQPLMSQSAQFVGMAATATAGWVGWAILIFVFSIYFAIDLPRFAGLIKDAVYQPGYRRDVERLLFESGRIWNGYLRGQTILAILLGVMFGTILSLLGVRYALVLGLLAALLNFIPYIGPFIIITLSTVIAVFQGDNWLGLSPMWYGMVVLLAGLILQQIDGNWLNPRIVGGVLGLHPLLVMIGAIMGSILAGVLGVMLAAPVLATAKLLGTYAWRKMFDLDPFPEAPSAHPPPAIEPVSPAIEPEPASAKRA